MGIVLTGGTIVNADTVEQADLRIEGEVVERVGRDLAVAGDEVVDVAGCYLFPGGIDPHTHFDLDTGATVTADDFYTGSRAALSGGTTTVIDYATQSRGGSLAAAMTELAPELPPLLGHGLELAGASVQARSWATGIRTGCWIDAILAGDLERTQQEQGGAQWER